MVNELVSINSTQTLTAKQYQHLADVPPELEWLANIANAKTRRYYKSDVAEFITYTGLQDLFNIFLTTVCEPIAR